MKIVHTASLGHVGKPLTQLLVKEGHQVTVISRSVDRQREIEALGARACTGDLSNIKFLKETFAKADAVFCLVPPDYSVSDIHVYFKDMGTKYATAIKDAGIKRVVFLSSYGAELDHGTGPVLGSHNVEGILNKVGGIELTHVRATSFYYNFLGFIDMIKKTGTISANYGADKIPMVSPEDIAAVVANELTRPIGAKINYVASDERTGAEVANVLGHALGQPALKWKIITDNEMQMRLEQGGMPSNIAQLYVDMYASLRTGRLSAEYKKNKPTSFGKVKLEDYAKDFSLAYKR